MYKDSVVQIREIEARALLVVHLEQQNTRVALGRLLLLKNRDNADLLRDRSFDFDRFDSIGGQSFFDLLREIVCGSEARIR